VSGGGAVSPTGPGVQASVRSGSRPTVNISIRWSGGKSPDNSKLFGSDLDSCSESLGQHTCPNGWFWNIEGKGIVSDDAANWTVAQTATSRAKGYYTVSPGVVQSFDDLTTNTPDGPESDFLQKPSGQTTIYWIDGPGPRKTYGASGPIYEMTSVENFTTTFCTLVPTGNCFSIKWYLKAVVRNGGILDNTSIGLGAASTDF